MKLSFKYSTKLNEKQIDIIEELSYHTTKLYNIVNYNLKEKEYKSYYDNNKLYSDNYLFSDEEATRTVCSFKQTSYVAQMIGGIITNIVINFWSNILLDEENNFPRSVPFILEYNSDLMIFNVKE